MDRKQVNEFRTVSEGLDDWEQPCVEVGQNAYKSLKADSERLRSAEILLQETIDWRALDGDGITQPLLDMVRAFLGLPTLAIDQAMTEGEK